MVIDLFGTTVKIRSRRGSRPSRRRDGHICNGGALAIDTVDLSIYQMMDIGWTQPPRTGRRILRR